MLARLLFGSNVILQRGCLLPWQRIFCWSSTFNAVVRRSSNAEMSRYVYFRRDWIRSTSWCLKLWQLIYPFVCERFMTSKVHQVWLRPSPWIVWVIFIFLPSTCAGPLVWLHLSLTLAWAIIGDFFLRNYRFFGQSLIASRSEKGLSHLLSHSALLLEPFC